MLIKMCRCLRLAIWGALILGVVFPAITHSQPTPVDTKNATVTGDFTTATVTDLIVSGTNRGIAVCAYSKPDTLTVSSVTFNGTENFSFVVTEIAGGGRDLELWYLGNPTATTANVVVTLSGAATAAATLVSATSFSGVSPVTPVLSNAGECTDCPLIELALTSTVNNTLLFTCAGSTSGTQTWTHNAGQIERSDFANIVSSAGNLSTSYEVKAVAGLETLGSIPSANSNLMYIVMGIAPEVVAPGGARRRSPVIFR